MCVFTYIYITLIYNYMHTYIHRYVHTCVCASEYDIYVYMKGRIAINYAFSKKGRNFAEL